MVVKKAITGALIGSTIALGLVTTYGAILGLIYGHPLFHRPNPPQFPDWEGMIGGALVFLFVPGSYAAFFGGIAGMIIGAVYKGRDKEKADTIVP